MTITGHIFLIGLPGSGKSTLGKALAEDLGIGFVDTDDLIEEKAGVTITEIFDQEGEEQFRRLESEVIGEVATHGSQSKVVSLGGGAFQRQENREAVRAAGITIYLQNEPGRLVPFLMAKSDRPLLRPEPLDSRTLTEQLEAKLTALLQQRQENYEKADLVVPCDVLTDQAEQVQSIVKFLRDKYGAD